MRAVAMNRPNHALNSRSLLSFWRCNTQIVLALMLLILTAHELCQSLLGAEERLDGDAHGAGSA